MKQQIAARTIATVQLKVVPLLPDYGSVPLRWRLIVPVDNNGPAIDSAVPHIESEGARVLSIQPQDAPLPSNERTHFFILLEQVGSSVPSSVTVRLGDVSACAELPLGIDLCALPWERWATDDPDTSSRGWLAALSAAGLWQPARVPGSWDDQARVCWLRTRCRVPRAWQGHGLQLEMRALGHGAHSDAAFLNGMEIGRSSDVIPAAPVQRRYPLPSEVIRWDEENELAIAVWGERSSRGGLLSTPIHIVASPLFEERQVFSLAPSQPEADRRLPSSLGDPTPLRRMVVRDGVLYYEDGGEVALWGVNIYPQSWVEYASLKQLGIDPRRAVDQDLDDLTDSGIRVIRIHVFDTEISDAQGNLVLNEHLDVLHYIAAQCNRKGIYLWLTPLAWWDSPNTRPDAFSRQIAKQAMSMWPGAWPIEANYLRQLLLYVNPYTSRPLIEEPCLALFEVINEPWYWSFWEVNGQDRAVQETPQSTEQSLDNVRLAWLRFVPSKDWGTPEVFRYWRYDTVRRYINTMVDAIRSTGGSQPIAYSGFHSSQPQSDVEQAIADSRCNAITTWAYPGGLESEPRADTLNVLPNLGNWDLSARYPDKARLVYEFDAAGRATSASVYPALARHWRSAGVQVACQFQYDPTALAHLNWNWPTHYLNLRHTPEKMVSFVIGREVFRRLARGVSFQNPDDDQVFPPAGVSFHRNVSLLCAEDCYMQSQPTDWWPLPLPQNPSWIVSVGTCPYFEYEGSGVVMLELAQDEATLRIYPDVERLQYALRGTLTEPLTRLREAAHPFRLRLGKWTNARVERLDLDGETWLPNQGCAAEFSARAGVYRLLR